MVRVDVDAINCDKIERVLVCITSQISSQRLIDKAAEIADKENAELHILHVQQGNSIFNNADTPKMIHSLCQYGSQKGGTMHFYCHEDVPECIGKFVSEKYITKIIIGQPPVKDFQDIKELKKAAAKILNQIKNPVEAIIIPRDENTENMRVCLNMGIGF